MNFLDLLRVLSKSSPFAVTTLSDDSKRDELQLFKDYLYVKTDIEQDFEDKLEEALKDHKKIIFLCGSSGDGKSEILTRYSKKEKYKEKVLFHLDATHSLKPKETAIERLDILFDEYEENDNTLVVGINTGMLANYAHAGNNIKIKQEIISYLGEGNIADLSKINGIEFIDFKNYSNFRFKNNDISSGFLSSIYEKLASNIDSNLLYKSFLNMEDKKSSLATNYAFFKKINIEKKLIELIYSVKLMDDQFITTRSLLDFFYCLLSSDKYIFETLFDCSDNEILNKIKKYDPIKIRTKKIDNFIMSVKMGVKDDMLEEYLRDLEKIGVNFELKSDVNNLIRLFFLMQDIEFSNNYHEIFKEDLKLKDLYGYKEIWLAHNNLDDKVQARKHNKFYTDKLLNAINKYNSRNISGINSDEFLLSVYGEFKVLTKLEIKINKDLLKEIDNNSFDYLKCPIIINDKKKMNIDLNINLFRLIELINDGYQPNRNDKNTIVMLDYIVEEIRDLVVDSSELIVINGDLKRTIKDVYSDGSEIKVV